MVTVAAGRHSHPAPQRDPRRGQRSVVRRSPMRSMNLRFGVALFAIGLLSQAPARAWTGANVTRAGDEPGYAHGSWAEAPPSGYYGFGDASSTLPDMWQDASTGAT